jgi:hypothetical protein
MTDKRGKKIDIKWYKGDFKRATKIKIVIIDKFLKGNSIEIADLCKIVYDSDIEAIKYMYMIFHSYSKTYEIFASFTKQLKEYNKARMRYAIYTWNNHCDYKVENNKMTNKELNEYILSYRTNQGIQVHAIKPIHSSESITPFDKVREQIVQVMNKLNIKVKYMSNILVDCNYKQISIADAMDIIRQDPLLKNISINNFDKISKELESSSQFIRGLYPKYRPKKRYLEFSDCIFDTFTCKQLPKQKLYDVVINNTHKVEVHPCYKFDNTFIHYVQNIPHDYCLHIARIMSPEIFEWCISKIVKELTPQKNSIVLSGPPSIGKTTIFKPIFNIYKNVTVSDFNNFSLDNCTQDELIFCDNINICLKYNKNQLFKNDCIASTLLDGKPYGKSDLGNAKLVFSIVTDKIYYINHKYGTRMLIIELNDTIPRLFTMSDDNEEINENDGCSMILNLLLNPEVIKEYMHDKRIDNDWEKNVFINGRLVNKNQIDYEPKVYNYAYNGERYLTYKNLKNRL